MPKSRADPAFEISSGDDMILPERHPACRRREPQPGSRTERENLLFDAKGEATSGSNREGESTEAERRDGAARSSDEGSVIGLERRGCVCSAESIGQLRPSGNGRSPWMRQSRSRSPNGKSGTPSSLLRRTRGRLEWTDSRSRSLRLI